MQILDAYTVRARHPSIRLTVSGYNIRRLANFDYVMTVTQRGNMIRKSITTVE